MIKHPYKIGGVIVDIELRYTSRSKAMNLRFDPLRGQLMLALPPFTASREIHSFLNRAQNWVLCKLHNQPLRTPFINGNKIPIFGEDYLIQHHSFPRSKIVLKNNVLFVHGSLKDMSCSIKTWLKYQILEYLEQRAQEYAQQLDQTIHSIRVREVKSRWGSCSREGHLSFSWRLVFAPRAVVDYVCAHEVAHLVEMNHSKRFWFLVETLCPSPKVHIKWLKKNALRLFSYG